MSQYPGFIRRLLSTTVLGYFDSYDDPVALAEFWPMNGDREWAGRCVEWLNRYLARRPTPKESLHLVFSGWHECPLLTREEDFTRLIELSGIVSFVKFQHGDMSNSKRFRSKRNKFKIF